MSKKTKSKSPPDFGRRLDASGQDTGLRPLTRRDFLTVAAATAGAAAIVGGDPNVAFAAPKKTKIDTPVVNCAGSTEVSINLLVCAGATGLPAGFSIQWMTCEEYAEHKEAGRDGVLGVNPVTGIDDDVTVRNTWYASDDPRLCKASFSGNANLSRYNLAAGECVTVNVGEFLFDSGASSNCIEALSCDTCYVFRAFGHATSALNRSDFTSTLSCRTLPCDEGDEGGCTYTQGFWKTHGPIGCATGENTNAWPVSSLTLGSVSYTDLELCSILNTPAAGNGLIALAHQLIAAKLNVANGADSTDADVAIAAADALIGALVVPPVGAGTLPASATGSLITALATYNEGGTGPGHCA